MGIVLFDQETVRTTKCILNNSFSTPCLFGSYLTEPTSYPHRGQSTYLTRSCKEEVRKYPNALFSGISLFDGYLTERKYD